MDESILRVHIIVNLVASLLGNISPHVRAICLDWKSNDWIKLRFYLDKEPDETEKELVSVIWTEFESNLHTYNIHFTNCLDEIIFSKEPFNQLDHLKMTIFWRNEAPVF